MRLPLDQHRADRRRGLNTATFISGYQGSPLGGFDKELDASAQARRRAQRRTSSPGRQRGARRDRRATAASSPACSRGPKYDGVLGIWYGKAPGRGPRGDASPRQLRRRRHARRRAGAGRRRPELQVLDAAERLRGRRSTTLRCRCCSPATCRRSSTSACTASRCRATRGLWVGIKIVTNVADAVGTAEVGAGPRRARDPAGRAATASPCEHTPDAQPAAALRRWTPSARCTTAASSWPRALRAPPTSSTGSRSTTPDAWLGIVAAGKTYYDAAPGAARPRPRRRGARAARHPPPQARHALPARAGHRPRVRPRPRGDPRRRGEAPLPRAARQRRALRRSPTRRASSASATRRARPLLPADGELDADRDRARRSPRASSAGSRDRVRRARACARLERAARRGRAPLPTLARTPYFCSGCPHNRSTVVPGGLAGRRRHRLPHAWCCSTDGHAARSPASRRWAARARSGSAWRRSPTTPHLFQNIGDGTFFHSGLARHPQRGRRRRQHHLQDPLQRRGRDDRRPGRRGRADRSPTLTRWLEAEGVKRIIVTTDEPDKYTRRRARRRASRCWHRDRLDEAQRDAARPSPASPC